MLPLNVLTPPRRAGGHTARAAAEEKGRAPACDVRICRARILPASHIYAVPPAQKVHKSSKGRWRALAGFWLADFGGLRNAQADFGRLWRTWRALGDSGRPTLACDQEERAAHGLLEDDNSCFLPFSRATTVQLFSFLAILDLPLVGLADFGWLADYGKSFIRFSFSIFHINYEKLEYGNMEIMKYEIWK